MDDLVVELADKIINECLTYSEAIMTCRRIEHEIKLRAYEQKIQNVERGEGY